MEKRNGTIKGIAIGFTLCVLMYFYMLWASQSVNNETKVIPNAGDEVDEIYVTIDDGITKYEGDAVIIAADETTTVIQMGDKVYVASTKNVVYE